MADIEQYLANRERFPLEELLKYWGKWVAFSPDGTIIIASHKNPQLLAQIVIDMGYVPEEIHLEPVPFPGVQYPHVP